jgi:hypothetical protein
VDHASLPLDAAAAEGCVKVALTIFGEPASKANQRQLVSFPDGKGGKRPALIKSKKARNYESDALLQIPPAARLQLEGPVRVTLRVFYASQRPDLDESVILDVLQDRYVGRGEERELVQKGVYRNDRQVREKHVFHAIDRGGMSMTQDQAHRLRVLIQEAFELVLNKPIAFVLVAQDEERGLEIVTNAERRDLLPDLLIAAAEIVRTPPDNTIEITDHRATGESAGVKSAQEATPGMECGHAAAGALQPADHGRGVDGDNLKVATTPPPSAVSERCWRRIPPGFEEQCPHDATGGIRLKLYPALAIQKRYGKRDMLALDPRPAGVRRVLRQDDRDRGAQQPRHRPMAGVHQGRPAAQPRHPADQGGIRDRAHRLQRSRVRAATPDDGEAARGQRSEGRLMDETITAILVVAALALVLALLAPRIDATVEEWFDALW